MPRLPARRLVLRSLLLALVVIIAFSAWSFHRLRQSLPVLDGEIALSVLSAPVVIERDALGVPTLRAASRLDAASALGFLHAQDRFFQMDLSRRRAAGELAALVGEDAIELDRAARIHNFRTIARESLARLPGDQRALLAAYADGVNAGLASLKAPSFEYLMLRARPDAWLPEDSLLVVHAMWLDLQDHEAIYERSLTALRDRLGPAAADFFSPLLSPDDVAFDGSRAKTLPLPAARLLNVRGRASTATPTPEPAPREGSNSLALAGAHTATGAAMLANDMHLTLRVPNTWYRASLVFPHGTEKAHRVTGVTLPGMPFVVAGSNGRIAWGFTNANVDTVDIVTISASDLDRSYYIEQGEIRAFDKRVETIAVKGGDPVTHEILVSPWGPVVGNNAKGQHLALKWVAHDPDATNLTLGELETASTVSEAVAIAHRSGIPAQNFLVADAAGDIAWTIAGKLPLRFGFDGRLSVTMSYGDRRWDGFVSENQIPVISSRPELSTPGLNVEAPTRLFTANQRLLGGDTLDLLGDGGYESPMRAARVRELLAPVEKAAPRDLLAIMLDDQAPHLERWHALLARTLESPLVDPKSIRDPLRAGLRDWDGRARVDSTSYRLVREFRRHVIERMLAPIFASTVRAYPNFNFKKLRHEPAVWQLIEEKPAHLLAADYAGWDDLFAAAAGDVVATLKSEGLDPDEATWGRVNVARIQHPMTRAFPLLLRRWLDMPAEPLPGDRDVPRVQTPNHGASERFAVSPGREDEGIFHMPGGQSGHPLSPFYRAGHDAWVRGEATAFLPGPAVHTLTLKP